MTATQIATQYHQDQQQATAGEARDRAGRIRDGIENLAVLMRQAYQRNDHLALGYERWAAYIEGEFPESRLPARRELVALLSGQGMSERQIATVTGIDKSVVHRARAAASESEAAELRAADRDRKRQARAAADRGRVIAAWNRGITDEADLAEVTGVALGAVRDAVRSTPAKRAAAEQAASSLPATTRADVLRAARADGRSGGVTTSGDVIEHDPAADFRASQAADAPGRNLPDADLAAALRELVEERRQRQAASTRATRTEQEAGHFRAEAARWQREAMRYLALLQRNGIKVVPDGGPGRHEHAWVCGQCGEPAEHSAPVRQRTRRAA